MQPPVGPTPRPRQALQGTQASGPPVQKGCAPGGEEPGSMGARDTRGGGWGARGSWPSATLGPAGGARTPGPSTVGPSGASAWPEQVPGPPDPARPRLQPAPPAHPSARRTDQARRRPPRRAQREPDSGRGLSPAPPALPAPRPPPAAPGRRASPAESAALTSPARGAPSAAAGARPVPAAPAAAPARAPRPRKRFPAPPPRRQRFRAGANGGGGAAGRASRRASGARIPPRQRLGASRRTRGRAAALVWTPGGSGGGFAPRGLPPAFSSAPPGGGRGAPQRVAPRVSRRGPGRPGPSTPPPPGGLPPSLAQLSPSDTGDPVAFGRLPLTRAAPGGTAEGSEVQWL